MYNAQGKTERRTVTNQQIINNNNIYNLSITVPPIIDIYEEKYSYLLDPINYRKRHTKDSRYYELLFDYLKEAIDYIGKFYSYDIMLNLYKIPDILHSLLLFLTKEDSCDFEQRYDEQIFSHDVSYHKCKDQNENLIQSLIDNKNYKPELKEKINYYKPSRLSSPLYPLHKDLANLYYRVMKNQSYLFDDLDKTIRYDVYTKVYDHSLIFKEILGNLTKYPKLIRYEISEIETFIHNKKNKVNTDLDRDTIDKIVRKLMKIDLLTIDDNLNLNSKLKTVNNNLLINCPDIYLSILKFRQVIHDPNTLIDTYKDIQNDIEFIYLTKDGIQILKSDRYGFIYFNYEGFTSIYDYSTNDIYFMDNQHFDYVITSIEIKLNLSIIIYINEHPELNIILKLIDSLSRESGDYNHKVHFMKTFETLCLMKADLFNNRYINWRPIIAILLSMSDYTNTGQLLMSFIFGVKYVNGSSINIYEDIISELSLLDPKSVINLSTIHKLFYYSEVSEDKGIMKYAKRTHTKRKFDLKALEDSKLLFRKIFIRQYYLKFQRLPELSISTTKLKELTYHLEDKASSNHKTYETLSLRWFSDIRFKKNFDKNLDNNPILYAKDKASSPKLIKFHKDSASELIDVLMTSEYQMSKDLIHLKDNKLQEIKIMGYTDKIYDYKYPTKLCMKEREQKEEGRLFGCATTEHKHELSYLNKSIESVLRLFDGQFIAISNSDKKKSMHDNAQLLIQPNNYSLMLDIEGHNQSIQPENMMPFLEEFSALFGDEQFKDIAYYFTNLDVYYNYNFTIKSVYMKGQRGGIEGWMNHLWTLMTLIYSELLREYKVIDVMKLMVYSDDVNIIFKQGEMELDDIDSLYKKIQSHYIKFGFNVKASQTIISKSRSTLLRVHYFNGESCEPSLKKILSISSCTESLLVNESIDISAINSGINSSMEYSDRILTQLYLKWYKTFLVSYKTFLHYLFVQNNETRYLVPLVSEKLRLLMFTHTGLSDFRLSMKDVRANQMYLMKLFKVDNMAQLIEDMGKVNNLKLLFAENIHLLLQAVLEDDMIIHMYYMRITLPTDFGGYNMSTLSNTIMSGVSNNQIRTVDELLYSIGNNKDLSNDHKEFLINIIYSHMSKIGIDDELSLFTSEYPLVDPYRSTDSYIRYSIKQRMIDRIKNIELLRYSRMEEEEKLFKSTLINLSRENLNIRILQYYYENSVFSLMDTLYSKIETSRSFIKHLNFNKIFFENLFRHNTSSLRHMLFHLNYIRPNNTRRLSFMSFIIKYRSLNFPKIKFCIINELSYHNMLEETEDDATSFFSVKLTKRTLIREGYNIHKQVEVPEAITIKYLEEDKCKETLSIIGRKILNTIYLTKWIVGNDLSIKGYGENAVKFISDNNCYIKIADFSMSFINRDLKFLKFYEKIRLPSGGEIMHRLNNCKFKAKSFVKSLHHYYINFNIMDTNYALKRGSLIDSNINYGYCMNYSKLKLLMRQYINDENIFYKLFRLKIDDTIISNVRIKFGYNTDVAIPQHKTINYITGIDMKKIFLEHEYVTYGNLLIKNVKVIKSNFELDVLNFYNNLRHSYIWINYSLSGDALWLVFREEFDLNYPSFSGMSQDEFRSFTSKIIRDYYNDKRNSFKYITPKLREDLHDYFVEPCNDKEQIDLENSIRNVIRIGYEYYNSTHKISPEVEFRLTEILNRNRAYTEKYIMNLIYKFILDYCLSIFMNSYNKIEIDIDLTIDILKSYIIGNTCELIEYQLYLILRNLNIDDVKALLLKNINIIKAKLKYINRHLLIDDLGDFLTSLKLVKDINEESIPDELLLEINYESIILDTKCLRIMRESKDVMNEMRTITCIKAHPDSFYSLTGSDSICAAIGLIKYMRSFYGYLPNVCDLTAGRGDFHLAMKKMDVEHESFNRKDFYTNMCKIDSIRCESYDILDFSTMKFIDLYKFIIIDISFIKGDQSGLLDTIDNLIELDKIIFIRINSLNLYSLFNHLINKSNIYEVKLIHPMNYNYKPYQLYIEIKRGVTRLSTKLFTENVRQLMVYFKRSLTMPFDNISKAHYSSNNSVNSLFAVGQLDFEQLIIDYKEFSENKFIITNLENTLKELTASDIIPLSENQFDCVFDKSKLISMNENQKYYQLMLDYLNSLKYQVRSAIFEKLKTDDRTIMFCKVTNVAANSFDRIIQTSAFDLHRWRCALNLKKALIIKNSNELTIDNIMRLIEDETSKINEDVRLNSRQYEILIMLIYIAITDSYREVLNIFIKFVNANKSNSYNKQVFRIIRGIKLSSNLIIELECSLSKVSDEVRFNLVSLGRDLITRIISNYNKRMIWNKIIDDSSYEKDKYSINRYVEMVTLKDDAESINQMSDDDFIALFFSAMKDYNAFDPDKKSKIDNENIFNIGNNQNENANALSSLFGGQMILEKGEDYDQLLEEDLLEAYACDDEPC